MGLIMTTRGWRGASIVWTHASGAATYEVSGDANNPLDVARDLVLWLDNAERPWPKFSLVTMTVGDDGRRHRFSFAFTGSTPFVSVVPNAAWIACFGDTSQSPPTTARGTLARKLASFGWMPHDNQRGAATREGSFRMGHQGFAFRRPRVEDRLTPLEVHILSECQEYAARQREAYLLERETWRKLVVGAIAVEDVEDDATRFDVTITSVGAPA